MLSSKRTEIEQDWIPDTFTPVVSKWKMKCKNGLNTIDFAILIFPALFKVFVDDEGYHSPHGHAYEKYGIDPKRGALVIVRPDQCK